MSELAPLKLRRNEDRRLRAGHLWVFSNEVDTTATPLTGFETGAAVRVIDHNDRPLGVGYINPHALICARIVSRNAEVALDRSLITHRLNIALSLRQRTGNDRFGRIVFGESDGLPGLVVDRFGDVLVAQTATQGMEALKEEIQAALDKVLSPQVLVWKNDSSARDLEALPHYVETAFGTLSEPLPVIEAGLEMSAMPLTGQKTGWFYDQAANRERLMPWVKGARVLDVFSYVGAWGLRAAAAGASEVMAIDASAPALEVLRGQASRLGWSDRVHALQGDAFNCMQDLLDARERFDVVVLDPPAFIKRRKDLAKGSRAYRKAMEMGMRLLSRDGLLVACSCSWHYPRSSLLEGLQQAARRNNRHVQIVASLGQGPDHPVHPAIPETEYLKGFIARVVHED